MAAYRVHEGRVDRLHFSDKDILANTASGVDSMGIGEGGL